MRARGWRKCGGVRCKRERGESAEERGGVGAGERVEGARWKDI